MSRKDIGRREGGVLQRFGKWLAGAKPPTMQEGFISTGGNQVSQWPEEYDNTPLSGDRYVDGKCCRTVGEWKAANAEKYGHDI